jgi:RNA methyltransferase, TrmH family
VLTNPRSDRVKAVRALSRRAVRSRDGLFLAEGPQSVREVVDHRPGLVRDLYHSPEATARHAEVLRAAVEAGLFVHEVSAEVLAAMCDTPAPQGLLAVCRPLDVDLSAVLDRSPRLLVVLTNVRDPGNAGTVIRGASVDIYNPKVVRSTAGSLFHLPIVTGVPIAQLLGSVRAAGVRLLAADGSGVDLLHDVDLAPPHAWVMGNEAWGLERDVRDACDQVVRVPIYGRAESLNLAMAATVCLYTSATVQRRGGVSG